MGYDAPPVAAAGPRGKSATLSRWKIGGKGRGGGLRAQKRKGGRFNPGKAGEEKGGWAVCREKKRRRENPPDLKPLIPRGRIGPMQSRGEAERNPG